MMTKMVKVWKNTHDDFRPWYIDTKDLCASTLVLCDVTRILDKEGQAKVRVPNFTGDIAHMWLCGTLMSYDTHPMKYPVLEGDSRISYFPQVNDDIIFQGDDWGDRVVPVVLFLGRYAYGFDTR